jgi:hypothetical protein
MINSFKINYYYKFIGKCKKTIRDWIKCNRILGNIAIFDGNIFTESYHYKEFIESKHLPRDKIIKLLKKL